VERALEEAGGTVMVLLETTAGSGRVIGSRFEELAEMIRRVGPAQRARVGVCVDTCHVFSAGYDLRGTTTGWCGRWTTPSGWTASASST
jgi:AP endonuclease 1